MARERAELGAERDEATMTALRRVELKGTRLRRNWAWPILAALPFLVPCAALATIEAGKPLSSIQGTSILAAPFGFILSALLSIHAWKNNPRPRREAGALLVEDGVVRWKGEVIARRDEIDRVTHYRDGLLRTVVRLHRRGARDPEIVVDGEDDARAIVEALGFGPDRSTAKLVGQSRFFVVASWVRTLVHVGVFVGLGVLGAAVEGVTRGGPGAAIAIWALCIPILATLRLAPTTVELGADALSIRWLGTRRIIPLSDVTDIEPRTEIERLRGELGTTIVEHHGVVVSIRGEDPVAVRFGTSAAEIGERNQLIERFRELKSARERGETILDTAFLARGGRDGMAWVRALRSGSGSEGDMRRAPVPAERFWRLVEDASASPIDRAAAAVAVGLRATPEERQRIRIAADQSVDPELRDAFARAVDEAAEDEAVAEALHALEQRGRGA